MSNYVERSIRNVKQCLRYFLVIRRDLVFSFEDTLNLISDIASKVNFFPYTRNSLLCPNSFVNPFSTLHDINFNIGSGSITSLMKEVMNEVSCKAFEKILLDRGLEAGMEDKQVKVGDIVTWFKSGDDHSQGLLFGRVTEKKGSNYVLIPCNSEKSI